MTFFFDWTFNSIEVITINIWVDKIRFKHSFWREKKLNEYWINFEHKICLWIFSKCILIYSPVIFQHVITSVERNINDMFQYQSHSRAREARDYALIIDNNSYVQFWSLLQIFVIFVTTTVQVYFVRKLFDIKSSSGYSRNRI